MKSKSILFGCVLILAITIVMPVFAHPGGLDSNNGHKDKKNASGLGSYHYHCGDHPAHLHGPSKLCPYSKEYKEYKMIVDELKIYAEKVTTLEDGIEVSEPLSEEDLLRVETLLLSANMPFKLTEELLQSETTLFGKTNVKGLNVRKKQSASSGKVCTINLTGTVLIMTENTNKEWYDIMVFKDHKNYSGYVKAEMIDLIEKPEYFIGLSNYFLTLRGYY